MTEVEKVRDVLVEHAMARGVRDMRTHCKCGWSAVSLLDGQYELARHQAERIVAAQRKAKKAS